jgi:hypothetical protein
MDTGATGSLVAYDPSTTTPEGIGWCHSRQVTAAGVSCTAVGFQFQPENKIAPAPCPCQPWCQHVEILTRVGCLTFSVSKVSGTRETLSSVVRASLSVPRNVLQCSYKYGEVDELYAPCLWTLGSQRMMGFAELLMLNHQGEKRGWEVKRGQRVLARPRHS